MDDFERRLASRLAAYEESVPAPTSPAAVSVPASQSRPRPALLLVPAALVVVIGVVFGLAGSGLLTGVRPVGTGPVTSLEWETHPFVPGARVMALTAVGDRLIATGALDDHPAAWYSDDGGETWTAAEVEPVGRDGADGVPHAVGPIAQHDDTLVALDAYTLTSATVGTESPAPLGGTRAWTSNDDGTTWQVNEGVPGPARALVESATGFFAVGIDPDGPLGWASADGVSWTKVALASIGSDALVNSAASDGDRLAITGATSVPGSDAGQPTPTVWLSSDGTNWTMTKLAPGQAGIAAGVHFDGGSLLVYGRTFVQPRSQQPVLWTLHDGSRTTIDLPTTRETAAGTSDVVVNRLGVLVRQSHLENEMFDDEVWFVPAADSGAVDEQTLHRQVSAIAALSDRFVLFSQCNDTGDCESPSVSIGTPVSGSQDPASESPASNAAQRLAWTTRPFEYDASLRSISAVGSRLVVAGSDASGAAAWYSDDGGGTWTRATVESPPQLIDPSLGPVTTFGDDLVSLGSVAGTSGSDADRHGQIWTSADNGASWSYLPYQEAPVPFTAIASGPSGLVAAGNPSSQSAAEAWTASEEKVWHQAGDQQTFDGATITSLVSYSGGYVAVGYRVTNDPRPDSQWAAAWMSSDGIDWKLWDASNPSGPATLGAITDATSLPDGSVLASGYALPDFQPLLWRLQDGEWSEQGLADAQATRATVTSGSLGTILVTERPPSDASALSDIWLVGDRSSERWTHAQVAMSVSAMTIAGDRVVGIGTCGSTADCYRPMLVIGRLSGAANESPATPAQIPSASTHAVGPSPVPSVSGLTILDPQVEGSVMDVTDTGDGMIAVGTSSGHAAIWVSGDGVSWHSATSLPQVSDVPEGSAVWIDGVTATSAGYAAVGQVSTAIAGGAGRPIFWVSADGDTWTTATVRDSSNCGSVRTLSGGATGRLVAAGFSCPPMPGSNGDISAAVWFSDDAGRTWSPATVADAAGGGIEDAVRTKSGFVAGGSVADGPKTRGRVWESTDGETWTATWTDTADSAFGSVAATGDNLLVGGVAPTPAARMTPRIWSRSAEGAWTAQDLGDGECCGDVVAVVEHGGALVALEKAFAEDGSNDRALLVRMLDSTSAEGSVVSPLPASFNGRGLTTLADGGLLAFGSARSDGDVPAPAILRLPN